MLSAGRGFQRDFQPVPARPDPSYPALTHPIPSRPVPTSTSSEPLPLAALDSTPCTVVRHRSCQASASSAARRGSTAMLSGASSSAAKMPMMVAFLINQVALPTLRGSRSTAHTCSTVHTCPPSSGDEADVFHTFFGIAGLSLLTSDGVFPIDPAHALPVSVMTRLRAQQKSKACRV